MKYLRLLFALVVISCVMVWTSALAHDGWLQSNAARVGVGNMVYIDAMFGNHLNEHRSYKIVGKWLMDRSVFRLITPLGKAMEVNGDLVDVGTDELKTSVTPSYLDKNGYFVYSFRAAERGVYIMEGILDTVVAHGGATRAVKCTKAMVGAVAGPMANTLMPPLRGFDKELDQELEIIPLNDPTKLRVGDTLQVKVLFKGEPLAEGHLSVIPRGRDVGAFPNPVYDPEVIDGIAAFTFAEANYHLLVVHHHTMEGGIHPKTGEAYDQSAYAAALTVMVEP